MVRRDFIAKAGIATAFGALPLGAIAAIDTHGGTEPWKTVLLPAKSPLAHNGGMAIHTWVRSSMTNGMYSSVEAAVAPKLMGPVPHYHEGLDELMYVVEGTASILMGEDIIQVEQGGWHLRPRMIKHTFFNASDKPLRFIDMYFNQPFEEYLEQIFFELTPEKGYVDGTEKKNAALDSLNKKFGLIIPPGAFDQRNEIAKKYGLT
jgi:mannose-6-phosphate isomerase-like protein (cupin superfamily)